jgi:hypothetical protein
MSAQARVGAGIAASTDNPLLKAAATNSTVQKLTGKAVASAATNTYVQQKVGQVCSLAHFPFSFQLASSFHSNLFFFFFLFILFERLLPME